MFKTVIASALVAFAAANNTTESAACEAIFSCNACNANAACGWVKPKAVTAAAATRQCKPATLDQIDENLYDKVSTCEACDTNDCVDCYKEAGCKFFTAPGNRACSKEKPGGITGFAWTEKAEDTCKAEAASAAVEDKCKAVKSCTDCRKDPDCLWYQSKTSSDEQECNSAVKKDDTVFMGAGLTKEVVNTCGLCSYSDCEMCKKVEGCMFIGQTIPGVGSFTGFNQRCATETTFTSKEMDTCPVQSPAAVVGISAAALAATALAVFMN